MDTLFEREFAKRIQELRDTKVIGLTQTVLPQQDYHIQFGYLQCLRDIEAMMEEVRDNIRKG